MLFTQISQFTKSAKENKIYVNTVFEFSITNNKIYVTDLQWMLLSFWRTTSFNELKHIVVRNIYTDITLLLCIYQFLTSVYSGHFGLHFFHLLFRRNSKNRFLIFNFLSYELTSWMKMISVKSWLICSRLCKETKSCFSGCVYVWNQMGEILAKITAVVRKQHSMEIYCGCYRV